MELWQNVNYTAGISYLNNVFIYELDIQKANINVLYTKGIIDKSTYDFLYNSERMVRQVYVGKLQKDKAVVDALKSDIIESKRQLFQANDIKDYEVLSIKNDAVFLLNRIPSHLDFGFIHFIPKNVYTGFYKVKNMEMYYYYNEIDKKEYLDIKGISDQSLLPHANYFYQFLKDLFYTVQIQGVEYALRMLKDFYMQYIQLQLNINYYRRFDIDSSYHFKVQTFLGTGFSSNDASEDQKPLIDISNNLHILLELQKILNNMYFAKYR